MSENIFLRDLDSYQRNINPVKHYVEQASLYLEKMTGKPRKECADFIIKKLSAKDGTGFKDLRDPTVVYYERLDNGDREVKRAPLTNYIRKFVNEKLVVAPSFTSYVNAEQKESLFVDFVEDNKRMRSVAKKAAHAARASGDMATYTLKNDEQGNRKTTNNSLSGSFVAGGCVLRNPSAHSTLTSVTRCVSSFGNASNERIIGGNRHYWSPDVTTNNIISICNLSDLNKIQKVMDKYGLVYPSTNDVMECILRSLNLYVVDHRREADIRDLVDKLSPVEKAAVLYTGDFYHLRVMNDGFIKNFLDNMTKVVCHEGEVTPNMIYKVDEQIINAVHQICTADTDGRGKDYSKMLETPGVLNRIYGTAKNMESVVLAYRDFIDCFFLSDSVPATVAFIPNMLRRAVVMSDTDSTCFAVDDWVKWRFGEFKITPETLALGAGVMYIATQCMAHNLAVFSANMNVARDKITLLSCKPEYVWTSFMLTSAAKHYSASTIVQEGDVFLNKPSFEVKGVHLKSSNAPQSVTEMAHEMMIHIHSCIRTNNKIRVTDLLKQVADLEREIKRSLEAGELTYYRLSKIKEPEGYAGGAENSPYQYHTFWNQTFSLRYGEIETPPYAVIKVPSSLANKTKIQNWLVNMENKQLSEALAGWLNKQNKNAMNTFYLPVNYVLANGIPAEIKTVLDTKRLVLDITNVFRIIFESLSICLKDGYLISEQGY